MSRTLIDCAEDFQRFIHELADKHGKPPATVYQWWREYCDQCTAFDQSPVLFEFELWYAEKLKSR